MDLRLGDPDVQGRPGGGVPALADDAGREPHRDVSTPYLTRFGCIRYISLLCTLCPVPRLLTQNIVWPTSGQSGADNFMAYCVYDFYKLFRITGDRHWLDYALFLQDATKQVMDWDVSRWRSLLSVVNVARSPGCAA